MSAKDTTQKTLLVAFILCFVCSVVVSSAAVLLKPLREENKLLFRNKNILAAAGLYDPAVNSSEEVAELFSAFKIRIVDLDGGAFLSEPQMQDLGLSIESYNQRQAEKVPELSDSLTRQEDIARIKRRVKYAMVYIVEDNGAIDKIVLPINGYGLWGIMYGFLALEGDGNTVSGIGFYELKETPGLGYEVTNPDWTALWPGKKIYDQQGSVAMRVVKGRGQGEHQIDGLAGASLTSAGVQNLIQFWLGEDGFGPFIRNVTGTNNGG